MEPRIFVPVFTRAPDSSRLSHFSDLKSIILFKVLQCVPPATEPGISLIILPLMRILQRNLKRTYLIV